MSSFPVLRATFWRDKIKISCTTVICLGEKILLKPQGDFFFFFQKPFNKYIYIKRTFQSLEKNLKKNNHSKHKSSSTPTPFLQCRAPAFALSSSGCILKLLSFPREGMCLLCKLPCSQQWVWKRNLISENLQRAN